MKTKKIILLLIVGVLLVSGCLGKKDRGGPGSNNDTGASQPQDGGDNYTNIPLSDLQILACNAADDAGTCDTRLKEVGIVTKTDCCRYMGKCC